VITSVNNRKVADAARLKKRTYREQERRFLVEGAQCVNEGLASSASIEALFHSDAEHDVVERAERKGVATYRVSEGIMARLTSTVTPQGLVGVAPFLDVSLDAISEAGSVALLHEVRDPGNAGTVLRSADAAGLDGVVLSASSVDAYNPKTVRASAGSLFHVPVVRGADTAEAIRVLRDDGLSVLALSADGEADLYEVDLARPVAFVLGNEAWGLPDAIEDLADLRVRIPIAPRAQSLNLAAAATVAFFEWARQAREGYRAALEAVIAAAAHDIRSPLTAMKGFAFALSRRWESMNEEQRQLMFRGIAHDTDRMDGIIRLLVDAARIVGGHLDLFPQRVDVPELVATLKESLDRDPEHPDVKWTGGELTVLIDPDRLREVLAAFIEGEIWWGREGPILVGAEVSGNRFRMSVSRAGTELGTKAAAKLFLPRRPGTGSGSKIGLFVARGIAEAQGGTATASVHDDRLTFVLDVPLRAD
jgi:RNA methyltransferase, TrmH family